MATGMCVSMVFRPGPRAGRPRPQLGREFGSEMSGGRRGPKTPSKPKPGVIFKICCKMKTSRPLFSFRACMAAEGVVSRYGTNPDSDGSRRWHSAAGHRPPRGCHRPRSAGRCGVRFANRSPVPPPPAGWSGGLPDETAVEDGRPPRGGHGVVRENLVFCMVRLADLRAARHKPCFRRARPEAGPCRRERSTRNRRRYPGERYTFNHYSGISNRLRAARRGRPRARCVFAWKRITSAGGPPDGSRSCIARIRVWPCSAMRSGSRNCCRISAMRIPSLPA